MGLVRSVLPSLLKQRAHSLVVLGGPQVMNMGNRYLSPRHENLVICNGEGEVTFAKLLAARMANLSDFAAVPGLSYYRDGKLWVTPKQERLKELDRIPSPYLEGYYKATDYVWAPIETNRGCPFQCTYCYWGAATNSRVYAFDSDRVFAELEWLSVNGVLYIVITDANFGIWPRDVEFARHLAKCKREYGFPLTVAFSSSKNTPERVSEITRILDEAGLIATQPISLQTLSEAALSAVKRKNIKTSSYSLLQRDLDEADASSFIELIWPLPGETLDSYREGICRLCAAAADSFTIYPLLLINNVELQQQRDAQELITINDPDPDSEAEIVVATRNVSYAEFLEGLRFAFHATSLYSLRGLRFLAAHLAESGRMSHAALFTEFGRFCDSIPGNPYSAYIHRMFDALEEDRSGVLLNSEGAVVHLTLHEARDEFDELLTQFVARRGWLEEADLRFRFEMDLLNRPFAYSNTPVAVKRVPFEIVRIESLTASGYEVEIPARYRGLAAELVRGEHIGHSSRVAINYRTTQFPLMPGKPLRDHYAYCQDRLRRVRSLLPKWSAGTEGRSDGAPRSMVATEG
jgi:putative methyltransferase